MTKNCNCCKGAHDFFEGLRGANAGKTGLLLVLHHSDLRALTPTLPGFGKYDTTLWQTSTGKILHKMLSFCSLSPDDVYITNLIKCVFDRKLKPEDYDNCKLLLVEQMYNFGTRAIMLFGQKPAQSMLCEKRLEDVLHKPSAWFGTPIMAFNHPSAPWLRSEEWARKEYDAAKRFLEEANVIR